jgi:hypothetical protein
MEPRAVEAVDEATAAAREDIRAAMSHADASEHPSTNDAPPDPPAAASGAAAGHGAIRLRGQRARPGAAPAATTPGPDAVAAGPVGHGPIRLAGRATAPAEAEQPRSAPADPVDAATAAAREQIRAALSATA